MFVFRKVYRDFPHNSFRRIGGNRRGRQASKGHELLNRLMFDSFGVGSVRSLAGRRLCPCWLRFISGIKCCLGSTPSGADAASRRYAAAGDRAAGGYRNGSAHRGWDDRRHASTSRGTARSGRRATFVRSRVGAGQLDVAQ